MASRSTSRSSWACSPAAPWRPPTTSGRRRPRDDRGHRAGAAAAIAGGTGAGVGGRGGRPPVPAVGRRPDPAICRTSASPNRSRSSSRTPSSSLPPAPASSTSATSSCGTRSTRRSRWPNAAGSTGWSPTSVASGIGSEIHASAHLELAGRTDEAHRAALAGARAAAGISAHREAMELYRGAVRPAAPRRRPPSAGGSSRNSPGRSRRETRPPPPRPRCATRARPTSRRATAWRPPGSWPPSRASATCSATASRRSARSSSGRSADLEGSRRGRGDGVARGSRPRSPARRAGARPAGDDRHADPGDRARPAAGRRADGARCARSLVAVPPVRRAYRRGHSSGDDVIGRSRELHVDDEAGRAYRMAGAGLSEVFVYGPAERSCATGSRSPSRTSSGTTAAT